MNEAEKKRVLGVIGGSLTSSRWNIIQELIPKDRFEIITLGPLTERDIENLIGNVDFMIVGIRKIGKNIIKAAKKLKLIQRIGTLR